MTSQTTLRQWLETHQIYSRVTEESAPSIGLTISAKKTENMLSGMHPFSSGVFIDQKEVVDDFIYLGSSINSNGDMDKELSCRTRKTSAAFNQLSKILSCKKLLLSIKLRLYTSSILSTLLHGCENWHLKTSQVKKLDSFNIRCLRKINNA